MMAALRRAWRWLRWLPDDLAAARAALRALPSSVDRFERAAKGVHDELVKVNDERYRPTFEMIAILEGAGVRRKMSGIDVDFDVFLDALGPGGEAELAKVIADRKHKEARRSTRVLTRVNR